MAMAARNGGEDDEPFQERFSLLFSINRRQAGYLSSTVVLAHDLISDRPVVLKLAPNDAMKERLALEHRNLTYLTSVHKNREWRAFTALPHAALPVIMDQRLDKVSKVHYVVFNLAGMSLEQMHKDGFQFSFPIICRIAEALIQVIKFCHLSGVLHTNIHPGNVVVGGKDKLAKGKDQYRITLIDFSVSKDMRRKEWIRGNRKIHHNSFQAYCSANHEMRNFCKKDDLEMLAFMLLILPWQTLPWKISNTVKLGSPEQRREFMDLHRFPNAKNNKGRKPVNGPSLSKPPGILTDFLKYAQKLAFNDVPNYDDWIRRFQEAAKED